MPYMNLTPTDIAELLRKDGCANWSYKGSYALADYLEGLEDDGNRCHVCGCDTTRIQIDIVAIRCEYSEYDNALEALDAYDSDAVFEIRKLHDDPDAQEAAALYQLEQKTNVLAFDGGVIIEQF